MECRRRGVNKRGEERTGEERTRVTMRGSLRCFDLSDNMPGEEGMERR